jgi:hypothetical protein
MVMVIHNCQCETCPGSQAPKNQKPGEIVFGGTICNCSCHRHPEVKWWGKLKEWLGEQPNTIEQVHDWNKENSLFIRTIKAKVKEIESV